MEKKEGQEGDRQNETKSDLEPHRTLDGEPSRDMERKGKEVVPSVTTNFKL